MRPYLIYGAGAVGSALGAHLARNGHPVDMVARPPHARAIRDQGGLRVLAREEAFLAPVRMHTEFPGSIDPATVLFVTVQAHDLRSAIDGIGPAASAHPVVTWQNGIRAEVEAAITCLKLYGGVVRFTSTMLQPGEVRLRAPGQLIVGRHPSGRDPLASAMIDELNAAGFTAAESPAICEDKALKLMVNLVSGPPVLLRRTRAEPVLAQVQVAVLEEAQAVFAAAGVRAFPASGLGQPPEELLLRFRRGGSAPDTAGGVYNSTWQNLHHRRPRLENRYYHGEIVEMGKECAIPTPINARVLEILESVHAQGLGPEPFDREEFEQRFRDVVDFKSDSWRLPDTSHDDGLEI